MLFIMLTILYAHYRNGIRNFDQIDKYMDGLSDNTSSHVADVLADKYSSIESVAYLYGKSIKNTDVDLDLLAGLEEKSRFNMIRFISLDGTDYASDGKVTNVKDRDYFKRGMNGQSGICEVLKSRITGEKLIGFYAPVYFENKICGITIGFLTESTVSDIIVRSANRDSRRTFWIITVIFVVFLIYLIITYRKDAKVRSEELAYNKVNLLMRSVSGSDGQ